MATITQESRIVAIYTPLGDDVFLWQFGKLFRDFGRLNLVGDNENVLQRDQRQDSVDGLLEKGFFPEQGDELLSVLEFSS